MSGWPIYELHIDPLRPHRDLTEGILNGLKGTLAAMVENPFATRAVVVSVREIVHNAYRHADWDHPKRPWLRVWFEVMGDLPRFCVASGNAVRNPALAAKRLQELGQKTRSKEAASDSLAQALAACASDRPAEGGIGLLQIASVEEARMTLQLQRGIFDVEVHVAVPNDWTKDIPLENRPDNDLFG